MSLNFTHKRGDTFNEVPFEIKINDVAVDLSDTIIRMQLRKEYGKIVSLNLTSVDTARLTITTAVDGLNTINEQVINIEAGNYLYDIQFNFDGEIKTYVSGNFIITNDVTR